MATLIGPLVFASGCKVGQFVIVFLIVFVFSVQRSVFSVQCSLVFRLTSSSQCAATKQQRQSVATSGVRAKCQRSTRKVNFGHKKCHWQKLGRNLSWNLCAQMHRERKTEKESRAPALRRGSQTGQVDAHFGQDLPPGVSPK